MTRGCVSNQAPPAVYAHQHLGAYESILGEKTFGNDFLRALGAAALEELVDDQASAGPGEAALSMELPPLRFEESHGLIGGVGAAKTQQKRSPRAQFLLSLGSAGPRPVRRINANRDSGL